LLVVVGKGAQIVLQSRLGGSQRLLANSIGKGLSLLLQRLCLPVGKEIATCS
jgi:hypothetical protein